MQAMPGQAGTLRRFLTLGYSQPNSVADSICGFCVRITLAGTRRSKSNFACGSRSNGELCKNPKHCCASWVRLSMRYARHNLLLTAYTLCRNNIQCAATLPPCASTDCCI